MTLQTTLGALATMIFAASLSSCARPSAEEPARRENDLEERVARLEAALSTQGSPEEGGGRGTAPPAKVGQAISPHPGSGATLPSGAANPTQMSLEDRIDALEKQVARTLKTVRIPLELNKTGNEVCAEAGKACLTVLDDAGSARYDVHDKFCGHMVADCNARVTRRPRCAENNDYLLSPVKFYRSPGATGECNSYETETCESSPGDITALCLEQ